MKNLVSKPRTDEFDKALTLAKEFSSQEIASLQRSYDRLVSVLNTAGIVFAAAIAFFGVKSLNDAEAAVKDQLPLYVQRAADETYKSLDVPGAIHKKVDSLTAEKIDELIRERVSPVVAAEVARQRAAIVYQTQHELSKTTAQPQLPAPLTVTPNPRLDSFVPIPNPTPSLPAIGRFANARLFIGGKPLAEISCSGNNRYAEDLLDEALQQGGWAVSKIASCKNGTMMNRSFTVRVAWPKNVPKVAPQQSLHTNSGEVGIGLWELFQSTALSEKTEIIDGSTDGLFQFKIF